MKITKITLLKSAVAFVAISLSVVSFQNCGKQFKALEPVRGVPDPTLTADKVSSPTCSFNGQILDIGQSVVAYQNSQVLPGKSCELETRVCTDGVLTGSFQYGFCNVGGQSACLFDGRTLPSGASTTAYANSSVPNTESCMSTKNFEHRWCNDGVLSGSFNYSSCMEKAYESCLFNGITIAHGASVLAYQNSTVPAGKSCTTVVATANGYQSSFEQRICNNGILSGSYIYSSCQAEAPASCTFNGQTVAHGQQVSAYLNSTEPFGKSCNLQTRTCMNGSLSGSYTFGSCSVDAPASCMFNGSTVANGQWILAYVNSTGTFAQCQSEARFCLNGVLSGSAAYSSCSAQNQAPASCLFNGQTIAHGQSVSAYLNSTVGVGLSCDMAGSKEVRVCNNGSLSGTFNYSSCAAQSPSSCLFSGQTVAHGQNVVAFLNSTVNLGEACESQVRTCNNGALSGTYNFSSCTATTPASCIFNGQTIGHLQTVRAYKESTLAHGLSCIGVSELRTCNNGSLGGSYQYGSCSNTAPASCLFNGQTLAHGESVSAYYKSSVAYSESCNAQLRKLTCNNGSLPGSTSFKYPSCTNNSPRSCSLFSGRTVAHGETAVLYKEISVPFGSTCESQGQTIMCNDGTMNVGSSGVSAFLDRCYVRSASHCGSETGLNGTLIMHGTTQKVYENKTVPFGQSCVSEQRSCYNGVLSPGKYINGYCFVENGASCTFDGKTVPHGHAIHAYKAPTAPYGSGCGSILEARTCDNGVLSGSNTYASCVSDLPKSCSFNGQSVDHGKSVDAFYKVSTDTGVRCYSQQRYCSNGFLGGSYNDSSCVESNKPAYCDVTYKDMCDVYQYLYGRWPDLAGAQYWSTQFTNGGLPKACWPRNILSGTQANDCENYRVKWGAYPKSAPACAQLTPPPGTAPAFDAPNAAQSATCP